MRAFVTGATGLLGTLVVRRLLEAGHEVRALSRRPPGPPSDGVAWIAGDLRTPGPWQEQLAGADAVVHLAGEPIAGGRWTAARKERLRASRVEASALLADGLGRARPRPAVLVSASGVGYYGLRRGDEALDETASAGTDFLARLCQDWEEAARRAAAHGVRVVCLRLGAVLSPRGGALAKMLPAFRLGAGGPLGPAGRWFPWIHEDDAAGLALLALERPLEGPVNAVAPGEVRMGDFARALGRALRRPAVLPVPEWGLRLLLGELGANVNPGQRVVPRAALAAGYRFRHPTLEDALAAVLG